MVLRPNELRIEEDFRSPEALGTDLDSLVINEAGAYAAKDHLP